MKITLMPGYENLSEKLQLVHHKTKSPFEGFFNNEARDNEPDNDHQQPTLPRTSTAPEWDMEDLAELLKYMEGI